jgi:hypothetical protein
MSIRTDLSQAEKMVVDIESHVQAGTWQTGGSHMIAAEIEKVDGFLNQIAQRMPSRFASLYLEEMETLRDLRNRWLLSKNSLPPNFWSSFANSPSPTLGSGQMVAEEDSKR